MHHTEAHVGFSDEADKQLISVADVAQIEDWQKYVIILMDEMHIHGALLGFTNLGDINSHLDHFEQSLQANTISESALAKTMLVIMVRGLFTKLQYLYAQFSSVKLSGDQIFDPFWEAVYQIERCTLKVVEATFDGTSPNRRFLKLHGNMDPTKSAVLHKVSNPFADDGHMLFFFSDPNCWSSKARLLWVCETFSTVIYM